MSRYRFSFFSSSWITKYISNRFAILSNNNNKMEQDLTNCIRDKLSTMEVSSFLAPQVFGYVPTTTTAITSSSRSCGGAFRNSLSVQSSHQTTTTTTRMIKMELPIPTKQGLCHG
jgi:hypothetical protein